MREVEVREDNSFTRIVLGGLVTLGVTFVATLLYYFSMQHILIILSSAIALISPLVYSRAILRGDAKPHRTTRLVLLLITSLATASLFAQHDRVAIWLAAVSTLQSILLYVLSMKHGMGGWAKSDIACLLIAVAGIFLWQTTKDPIVALYAAITADFTGMVPALIKTYHHPETEVWNFYALDTTAGVLSLFAVSKWTLHEISYPIYILFINFVMVLLVLKPKILSEINK